MSGLARIEVERLDGSMVARLLGEIDLANARELEGELTNAVPNDALCLVLDLTETDYLDSAGVRLVFGLAESLRRRSQDLCLVVPLDSPTRRVLDLCGVEQVAAIAERVDVAVATTGE
jgi:anti-anti-sigma factor